MEARGTSLDDGELSLSASRRADLCSRNVLPLWRGVLFASRPIEGKAVREKLTCRSRQSAAQICPENCAFIWARRMFLPGDVPKPVATYAQKTQRGKRTGVASRKTACTVNLELDLHVESRTQEVWSCRYPRHPACTPIRGAHRAVFAL